MAVRPPIGRIAFEPDGLVVDSFAGGGGASTGIEEAIGRPVDIAINHDAEAIAMHKANHPETRHYQEDIWSVDPKEACGSRPVALAWFSPDCTHFSRAKGTKPLEKNIRGLAWVVIRWAEAVRPRRIILENVQEFTTWGPLRDDGRPDPGAAGETFRAWLARLVEIGYRVEFRSLVAADYGAPTTRKRFYLIATYGNLPIAWPDATHGTGKVEPWRTAAEIIDWTLPCPSIFGRARPLAEATQRRIAIGMKRYVIESGDPFIVPLTHGRRGDGSADTRVHGIDEPVRTITGANRGELALVAPFLVRHGHYSHRSGAGLLPGRGAGLFRGQRVTSPLATVCATNDKHLVAAFLTKHYGGVVGHEIERPIGTVTAKDHHALSVAYLTKFYGTSIGADMRQPLPTVTAGGDRGGGHIAAVRAFLIKYYGASGKPQAQGVLEPLHTVTTKARFGLVTIAGEDYAIADIGMRMLQPHELYAAQGFPEWYQIAPEFDGKPLTKTAQIKLCGNSVSPRVARALVAENVRVAA